MIKCAFRALLSCLGQFNHVARPVNVSMVLSIKDFSLIFSYMVLSLGSVAKKPNLHNFFFIHFFLENLNFARLFACLTPVFLLKKRPPFAHLFVKMSASEE